MLTQSEADALFAMPKKPESADSVTFPNAGGKLLAEFVSLDSREIFLFNITRASIAVSKCTYQKRARQVYPDEKSHADVVKELLNYEQRIA